MTYYKNITDKVARLFKKYGIKSVTMDDVASEMGMSKKTLYQIVKDKNELVKVTINSEFRHYNEQLGIITKDNSDAILTLIRINGLLYHFLSDFSPSANYDLQKYHPEFYDKIKTDYVSMFLSAIKDNLQLGIKEGVYRKEMSIDIISKLHLAKIEQIPNSDLFTQKDYTSAQFIKEVCLYHLNGIMNSAGRAKLNKYLSNIDNIIKPEVV